MSVRPSSSSRPAALRRRRWWRALVVTLAAGLVSMLLLWVGIHRIPWLGPALADGVRAVVGPAPVAWAEDVAYGWQDRFNGWRHGEDAPHTYWDVSPEDVPSPEHSGASPAASASAAPEARAFPPAPFEPPHPHLASKADGVWVPVGGRAHAGEAPTMVKTMVHPDRERPYTVLAIVAMGLQRLRLHSVPGSLEPRGEFPEALRTGLIPEQEHDRLIAAFNGGFQTIHGGYAMMVDGHTVGETRDDACTVALLRDGSVRIRSWRVLEPHEGRMRAYRQTPRCLVERGARHPDLANRYNTSWGAVVGGGTVIRRSALGRSEDGNVLFFGMGDSLTARSLADGMKVAGAYDVAQLDVNHVFPRFVLFEDKEEGVEAVAPLCRGFSFSPGDYVKSPMPRDFFYVTASEPE